MRDGAWKWEPGHLLIGNLTRAAVSGVPVVKLDDGRDKSDNLVTKDSEGSFERYTSGWSDS